MDAILAIASNNMMMSHPGYHAPHRLYGIVLLLTSIGLLRQDNAARFIRELSGSRTITLLVAAFLLTVLFHVLKGAIVDMSYYRLSMPRGIPPMLVAFSAGILFLTSLVLLVAPDLPQRAGDKSLFVFRRLLWMTLLVGALISVGLLDALWPYW